ncbi:Metallothionein expression activator [Lobulomyces angularis]|nr:Metallothionein expression activator [Lobulomyces angularis]
MLDYKFNIPPSPQLNECADVQQQLNISADELCKEFDFDAPASVYVNANFHFNHFPLSIDTAASTPISNPNQNYTNNYFHDASSHSKLTLLTPPASPILLQNNFDEKRDPSKCLEKSFSQLLQTSLIEQLDNFLSEIPTSPPSHQMILSSPTNFNSPPHLFTSPTQFNLELVDENRAFSPQSPALSTSSLTFTNNTSSQIPVDVNSELLNYNNNVYYNSAAGYNQHYSESSISANNSSMLSVASNTFPTRNEQAEVSHSSPSKNLVAAKHTSSIKSNPLHNKGKSNVKSTSQKQNSPMNQQQQIFACTHVGCTKVFTRNFNLKSHQKIHLGLKPFKCAQCKSTFTRKNDLFRHSQKIHPSE